MRWKLKCSKLCYSYFILPHILWMQVKSVFSFIHRDYLLHKKETDNTHGFIIEQSTTCVALWTIWVVIRIKHSFSLYLALNFVQKSKIQLQYKAFTLFLHDVNETHCVILLNVRLILNWNPKSSDLQLQW